RITISNNILRGASMLVMRADQLSVLNNQIIGDTSNRALEIRDCTRVRVSGGYVEGNFANAGAESAMQVTTSSGTTSDVTVAATTFQVVDVVGNVFCDDQTTPTQTKGIWLSSGNSTDFVPDGTLCISTNCFGRGITTAVLNDAHVNRFLVAGMGARDATRGGK